MNHPFIFGSSEALTTSPHDFSLSQWGKGLGWGFSKATPPVRRNLHTCSSTSPLKKIKHIISQGKIQPLLDIYGIQNYNTTLY